MKQIRTVPSYLVLEVDTDTDKPRQITGTGVVEAGERATVSDADADRYVKLGDELGVHLDVVDAVDEAESSTSDGTDPAGATGPAPALTGQGAPVPTVDTPSPAGTAGKTKEK